MRAILNDEMVRAIDSVLGTYPDVSIAAVFGSVARGEGSNASDVDIAVSVSDDLGLSAHLLLAEELEAAMGRRVDLITLREDRDLSTLGLLGEEIAKDGVIVYERKAERPSEGQGCPGERTEGVKVRR